MPTWAPDGQSIAYTTWTIERRPHQARAGGRRRVRRRSPRTRATTSIRCSRRTARASRSLPARHPISSTPSCSTRRRPITTGPTARGRDRRHRRRRTRSRSAGCRPTAARRRWWPRRRADAGCTSPAATTSRVYFRTNRGLQSITLDGLDRRTLVRVQGVGPATTRRRPTRSAVARWHAGVREPAGQASPVLAATRRTRDGGGADQGRGENTARAGDADVGRGRRLPRLDPRRRQR